MTGGWVMNPTARIQIGNFFFALHGQEGHVPFTVVFFRARNISVADSRHHRNNERDIGFPPKSLFSFFQPVGPIWVPQDFFHPD
jgi:hypothetical protein